jgi:hypothetical protein
MVILFPAIIGNDTIGCAISVEALADHFENNPMKPTTVFSHHRTAIEHIAEKLIALKRFEDDGSILIRSSDC